MPRDPEAQNPCAVPYLEHFPSHGGPAQKVCIDRVPFRIGRSNRADFVVSSQQVSKEHAEIIRSNDQYYLRDLSSTNGTFVNGLRVEHTLLSHDDIIHVAHEELRFVAAAMTETTTFDTAATAPVMGAVPPSISRGCQYMQELLQQRSVRVLFQPIVDLDTNALLGYEGLGRGTHTELSVKPAELFRLADQCGLSGFLSAAFREAAIEEAMRLSGPMHLFLNLHPVELAIPSLLESLRHTQNRLAHTQQLVVEINEHAAPDLPTLCRLRRQLKDLGILVAYDDFGAGRARFLELAELPPDFIKLDMQLIRDIHLAESRQGLIQALTQASSDLGAQVIAEGVETTEEAEVCRELGCHLGQGYFFGRPQSPCLLKPRQEKTHQVDVVELRSRLRS
jgi:EAL domain-containing protein (putative c-di-GMP-specific phosphodiesterase class I)